MDGPQFDAWTRRLTTGVQGRRAALKAGLAAAASGLLGQASSEEAAARPRCPNQTGCNAECRNTRRNCRCVRRSNGDRICVHPCCSDRRCDRDNQCRNTEVCMETDCCTNRGTFCVQKCTERRPDYCRNRRSRSSTIGEDTGNPWGAMTPE